MATAYRTTAIWSGFQGAPGYTKFSWMNLDTDAARNAAGAAMRTFLNALSAYLQPTWTIQVQPTVQGFDVVSGLLVSETDMTTPPAVMFGAGPATNYAGGSGFCINWKTSLFVEGRRLRGRTFFVPAVSAFAVDGTLDPAVITAVTAAGAALIASGPGDFAIWHRRFSPPPDSTQINGAIALVDAVSIKDSASQLRSRRT